MMRYFGTVIGTLMILGGSVFIYLDFALRPLQLRIEELRNRTATLQLQNEQFKKEHGLK